jgi:RNA polymerase sigma-54 factor
MALEIRQSLKLTQSLIMTQKLQQAIKLLQLSQLELVGEIQQVLETNPVLERNLRSGTGEREAMVRISPPTASRPRRRARRTARPNPPWKSGIGIAF